MRIETLFPGSALNLLENEKRREGRARVGSPRPRLSDLGLAPGAAVWGRSLVTFAAALFNRSGK